MKLIYITSARIPTEKAHGYQICKMCEAFGDQGIEVELWSPTRRNDIKEDVVFFYGIKNNFKIKKIKSFDFLRYGRYLGKLSFRLFSLGFMLKLLFKNFDKNAVIYSREPEICWLFNLKGYKTVLESHNWPNKNRLFKFFAKNSYRIIAITHGLAKLFIKEGLAKNNILVAPDGVDLNEFDVNLTKGQARGKLNLPLDKKIALYTGHLYEWKGVGNLAKAAGRLSDDCLVIFVGGVEADAKIFKEKNKKLIDKEEIALYQHQPHNLIPVWLKSADVLILPNKGQDKISRYYTSPLKLFEYMASQRPIVASDLPSIREVLKEDNCLFCRPDNSEDLADKIELVLNDSGLTKKIAEQAYEDVKKYTWEKRVEKIIGFIK